MNNCTVHSPYVINHKDIFRESRRTKHCITTHPLIHYESQLFLMSTLLINTQGNELTRGSLGQQQPARQAVQLRYSVLFRVRLALPH